MMAVLMDIAFSEILPYLIPTIFILGAITIADSMKDLIIGAFSQSASHKRRRS